MVRDQGKERFVVGDEISPNKRQFKLDYNRVVVRAHCCLAVASSNGACATLVSVVLPSAHELFLQARK
jgi:hypothetical protein